MLRNRSDQMGKHVMREVFLLCGDTRRENEVPPGDAQRIDLWVVPDEARRGVLAGVSRLAAKIAESPAMLELWSATISVPEFHASMRKLYAWHHTLELRDKRVWELPALWHLCAGRPEAVFAEFSFDPVADGPTGLYRFSSRGIPVFVVVIAELPRVRDTLLFRLLGRPAVRRHAIDDLAALEPDAIEHQVADESLIRLYSDLVQADPATLSEDDQEFVMGEWLERRDRELVQSAVEKARREARRETRREARVEVLRPLITLRLGRELTRSELVVLGKRVREVASNQLATIVMQWSPAELAAWLVATKDQR